GYPGPCTTSFSGRVDDALEGVFCTEVACQLRNIFEYALHLPVRTSDATELPSAYDTSHRPWTTSSVCRGQRQQPPPRPRFEAGHPKKRCCPWLSSPLTVNLTALSSPQSQTEQD